MYMTYEQYHRYSKDYEQYHSVKSIIKLTSKYGLHADKTTLCAFRHFPSAANVQSTNVPFSNNVSKTATNVD